MAEAEKIIKTRTVTKTIGVTLTLTTEEAGALAAVLKNVGGLPCNTLRGKTDKVLNALCRSGFYGSEELKSLSGSVYFQRGGIQRGGLR